MPSTIAATPSSISLVEARFLRSARVLGLMAGAIGGSVLAGWAFQLSILMTVLPGLVTMKPNTAICLLFGGTSLFRVARPMPNACKDPLATVLASAMALLGVLTLVEYLSGLHLGIDELLFKDPTASGAPGRMAPLTAVNSIGIGFALACLPYPRRTVWAHWLAVGVASISILAIVGYLYGVGALYQSGHFTAVALHTSTAFLLLCIGIWCARSQVGFMRLATNADTSGLLVRRCLPAAILLPFVIGWLRVQGVRLGWYGPELGVVIVAMANAISFVTLLWIGAFSVRAAEHRRTSTQRSLRESEEKYRSLFDSIDAGFCVVELIWDELGEPVDYRYLEVNPAFEQQTGLTNAVGRTVRELVPGIEGRWPAAYGRVARTGTPMRFTESSEAMGRWYDLYAFPVGTEQPWHVAVLFNDITERRRSEEMLQAAKAILQESENKFRQLADAMPQIVWTARPDGVLDYTNQRWYEYIQRTEAEWNVADWHLCVHPDDIAGAAAVWAGALTSGEPYATEFRVRRGDGGYRWFLVRALPIREAAGLITRWYGTCTDIQEQRALLEQNAQLLHSERTARAEAERIGHMKDEFLATLSHELRTPLNAILGWTQVLRGDPANSEDIESGLTTIERNARAQNAIIEDLLDMSKIVSGKVRLDVQALDLHQVVRSAVDTMQPAANAKSIRLQALIDPEARMISGDPNRLQQVFWNLLSNAIKFTPKGGNVQVQLQRINSHLEVSVIDSGEGIALEFLPHVFDRFRQQDASTTRRHGGLGLGLAIVKQLVELHGGGIHVESEGPGKGTTFRVMLPLWVVRTEADPADEKPEHPHARRDVALPIPIERLNLAGIKALVVDDEADARALIKRLLEDHGVEVRLAASAAEALEALAALPPPDILISDIGMPEQDGFELIRQVRALPTDSGGVIRAVALTAYARSEDRLKVLLEGFQAHLAKPVEAAELLALVASLTGRVGR